MKNGQVKDEPKKRKPIEGREWAYGLQQHEFEVQWARRYPACDVIPSVDEWPYVNPQSISRDINPVLPDSYVEEYYGKDLVSEHSQ